jgi:hypothetical protein
MQFADAYMNYGLFNDIIQFPFVFYLFNSILTGGITVQLAVGET